MKVHIPDHIDKIHVYDPGKTIAQLKKEYGWDQLSILWNNENTLGYSPKSRQAVIDAYERINYYPDPVSSDLRERLAKRLTKNKDQIVLANGSESCIMLAIRALCESGDQLLTSEGTFVILQNWARINQVQCDTIPLNEGYGFDLDQIKKKCSNKTKIIYLANANNPTGTMISRAELIHFMDSIPEQVVVIVDEAYFEFSVALSADFPDTLHLNYPNLLTLRTFSKAYGIAGARLGYAVGDASIISAMHKSKLTFEPTALAQAAGTGALDDTDFLKATIENNTEGIQYQQTAFERMGIRYIPSVANFIMTLWDDEREAKHIAEELMKRGVLVRPLSHPVAHGIRISIGRPDENRHLIEALEEII